LDTIFVNCVSFHLRGLVHVATGRLDTKLIQRPPHAPHGPALDPYPAEHTLYYRHFLFVDLVAVAGGIKPEAVVDGVGSEYLALSNLLPLAAPRPLG
jgi:hypothetical protein